MPPAAAPTREIGHAGIRRRGIGTAYYHPSLEEVVDLTWPTSVRVYNRMRTADSKIASALQAMMLPILSADWRVRPRKASDDVVQRTAHDLGLPILDAGDDDEPERTRDRFDWTFFLRHALLSRVFGFMPFEQVYRIDADGFARIRKLAPRMPHTLTANGIKVAEDGGLEGIEQAAPARLPGRSGLLSKPVFIPESQLVMFSHNREGANWHGQSIFRAIYRDYVLKDHYHRISAIAIDRNGAGVPIYEDAPPTTGMDMAAEAAAGQALAEGYRAGESAGGRIPAGASFKLHGVEGSLPPILDFIRYHDEQIAANTLEMFSSLPSAPNGSRALGDTLLTFFEMALNAHSRDIATVVTNHVVEDYVDVNWGPGVPAPAVECGEIGADQQITAVAIKQLIDSGAITPDASLERYLRRFYRMPVLEEPDDAAAEMDADELARRVEAAGALIRAGFEPADALVTVGLDPMEHTGLLPVTLQSEDAIEAEGEAAAGDADDVAPDA